MHAADGASLSLQLLSCILRSLINGHLRSVIELEANLTYVRA